MSDNIAAAILLVVLLNVSTTIAANAALEPRLSQTSRILFYASGIVIVLGTWSLWAWVRGYDPEVVFTAWASAAICGIVAIMARLVRRAVGRLDHLRARNELYESKRD